MDQFSTPAIAVVGAGMAGLACATALQRAGHDVRLVDKGHRPGGRMSTRRLQTLLGDAWFDYGAQYFTARDAAFRLCVDRWIADGLAAPWPAAGVDAFVGVPGMSAPIAAMAMDLTVSWSTRVTTLIHRAGAWDIIAQDGRSLRAATLVVALPAEQAKALLASPAPFLAARAAATQSRPCWTLMAAFAHRLPIREDCWRDDATIGWAARNCSKPCRTGPESWVLQATPEWSLAHLEDDATKVETALLQALSTRLATPLPPPITTRTRRWRYARSGSLGATALWDRDLRLGVCGDWLIGPRVEAAWLSGTALAETIRLR